MLKNDDEWFGTVGERDGKPIVIRGRQHLQEHVGAKTHSRLLSIRWHYESENALGLPAAQLCEEMAKFENLVVEELEKGWLCIFFCIRIHDGEKEWLAYVGDVQEACDRINRALAEEEPFPVEISVDDDPGWQEYRDLLKGLEEDHSS